MSRNQRLSFLGIAAVIAVVAIVVLTTGGSGDTSTDDSANTSAQQTATPSATPTAAESDEATPTPTATPTAKPKPEAPLLEAGKVTKLRYDEGETVRFRVRSEDAEEVHIHGYDIKKDLEPGETANVSFKATITGIFEIEFEQSAEQIGELRVDPK